MRVHFSLLFLVSAGAFNAPKNEEESCSQRGDSCTVYTKGCSSVPVSYYRSLPKCNQGSTTFNVCCSKLLASEICSKRPPPVRLSSRISYGNEAKRRDWPWIVTVAYYDKFEEKLIWVCGGSLLNDRFVLTAAHCKATFKSVAYHLVRLGHVDLESNSDGHVDIKGTFFPHGDYIRNTAVNDIALIKLESRVLSFNDVNNVNVLPVCLPVSKALPTNYVNKQALVAGWGMTEVDQKYSSKLLEAEVKVKDASVCTGVMDKMRPELKGKYSADMWVCTESEADGNDTCRRDSGGPIMVELEGGYYQVGVVSQGTKRECGSENNIGFYMNVTYYLKWIYETMEN